MPTKISGLPEEALWQVYRSLPTKKRILLSRTCRKLRQAATTLPNKHKYQIALSMENLASDGSFGMMFMPANKLNSGSQEMFQKWSKDIDSEKEIMNDYMGNITIMHRRFKNTRALADIIKPLLNVTAVEKMMIQTTLRNFFGKDWVHVCRVITRNKPMSSMLTLDLNSDKSDCRKAWQLLTVPSSLLPYLDVVSRVCLLTVLWHVANTGLRSLDISYYWPLSVVPFVRLEWFSHLTLYFFSLSSEFTTANVDAFDKFIRKFLAGDFNGSSFCFIFMANDGKKLMTTTNPLETQLNEIRDELKQSKKVCYHEEDIGIQTVWNTINRGQHRISWQGSVLLEDRDNFYVRVKGMRDPDDVIPRTRPLTKALLNQMERTTRHMVN